MNYTGQGPITIVNYLSTNRPLTVTLYCRHDLQVFSREKFGFVSSKSYGKTFD